MLFCFTITECNIEHATEYILFSWNVDILCASDQRKFVEPYDFTHSLYDSLGFTNVMKCAEIICKGASKSCLKQNKI